MDTISIISLTVNSARSPDEREVQVIQLASFKFVDCIDKLAILIRGAREEAKKHQDAFRDQTVVVDFGLGDGQRLDDDDSPADRSNNQVICEHLGINFLQDVWGMLNLDHTGCSHLQVLFASDPCWTCFWVGVHWFPRRFAGLDWLLEQISRAEGRAVSPCVVNRPLRRSYSCSNQRRTLLWHVARHRRPCKPAVPVPLREWSGRGCQAHHGT